MNDVQFLSLLAALLKLDPHGYGLTIEEAFDRAKKLIGMSADFYDDCPF